MRQLANEEPDAKNADLRRVRAREQEVDALSGHLLSTGHDAEKWQSTKDEGSQRTGQDSGVRQQLQRTDAPARVRQYRPPHSRDNQPEVLEC